MANSKDKRGKNGAGKLTRREFIAAGGAGLAGTYMLGLLPPGARVQAAPMPADAPSGGQTIIAGWESGPNGLDIDTNYARRSYDVYRGCSVHAIGFEPKAVGAAFQPDFDKMIGEAAKEWELNDDWSKITITLKEGIMSPTGNELTTDDVLWRFQRMSALQSGGYGLVELAQNVANGDAWQKDSRYTYTINMQGPNALAEIFPAHEESKLVDAVEYKKHATEDDPWATKWAGSNFAGHGPWKLAEYVPGESWTIVRNENYHAPEEYGNVTKVVNRVIPSSANRVALLQSGDIDIAFDLQASELLKLEQEPGIRLDKLDGNLIQWLGFNVDNPEVPELQDVNVRKAIGYALPFDLLLERPYLGMAKQMKATVPPPYKGYDMVADQVWADRARDLDKAKEFMAQSAYPDGFSTTLHYPLGLGGTEETAIIIKAALAEIGIDATLVSLQTGDYWSKAFVSQGFPAMYVYRDMCGTPDVNFGSFLYFRKGGCCNPGDWGNEEVNRLFAEAQASPGEFEKRAELQRQIEDIVWNKDPYGVTLAYLGFQAAARENVGGWLWNTLNTAIWTQAWKKEA